jgi:hypothetical protein
MSAENPILQDKWPDPEASNLGVEWIPESQTPTGSNQ